MQLPGLARRRWAALAAAALFTGVPLLGHNIEARYIQPLDWRQPHFSRILGIGYSYLGLNLDYSRDRMEMIGGRPCAVGNQIGFVVNRAYAYDIDEPVQLTVTYAPQAFSAAARSSFLVLWGKNGGDGQGRLSILTRGGARFEKATVTLSRARFAGLGSLGISLAIGSPDGNVAICGVQIERSYTTPKPLPAGNLQLRVEDPSGAPTPARLGIYDARGHAPLPSEQALLIDRFADKVRLLNPISPRAVWPSPNRMIFYANGGYATSLPAGVYELAASHGPEFRFYHGHFTIRAGHTTVVTIHLKRYADLPSQGWLSGDDHIHLSRDQVRDPGVWGMVAAEDVHIGNLLQMGNIHGTYFEQPAWGRAGRYTERAHTLVSGQEDPRTGQLGHTIQLDLQKPDHASPDTYFLYDRVFAETLREGGLPGYAHLNAGWFQARRGLALDMPFGLVDFAEVLQYGRLMTSEWYCYLDLGYKLTPSAGSDFPYSDLPGAYRVYAAVPPGTAAGNDTTDAWFRSLKAGNVYVTDGPFLRFSVNGQPMGSEIHVKRGTWLDVSAAAALNPDVDQLRNLQFIVEGDTTRTVPANGKDTIEWHTRVRADHSFWIAIRADGVRQAPWNMTVAHSAPIYVVVDGEPWWKRVAVPTLVARQEQLLRWIVNEAPAPNDDLEYFDTNGILTREWGRQLPRLRARVRRAEAAYQQLLRQAKAAPRPGNGEP